MNSRVVASPLSKKLASEHSIKISEVPYKGKRITSEDIKAFLNSEKTGKGSAIHSSDSSKSYSLADVLRYALPAEKEIIELSPMQKVIGKRLSEAKQKIPHFYIETACNVTSMINIRSNVNKKLSEKGLKISMNDMFVCAISRALARNVAVNSVFLNNKIVHMPSVDVAIAVAIADGLITPVVFGAHLMSLVEISLKLKSLIKKAREKRLKPEEFKGGTFTVSNLGMFQVDSFLPIINSPQAGIIALGKSALQPVWNESTNSFIPEMKVRISMAADHRIVNGDQAARFIGHVKEIVECPELMLL